MAEGVELWATVGLHPHDAVDGVDSLDGLLARARRAGRSDAGVERHRWWSASASAGSTTTTTTRRGPPSGRPSPARSSWPTGYGLTLVIHTREAWDDTSTSSRPAGCPSGPSSTASPAGPTRPAGASTSGAWLSFSGVVTFKNAADVREAAALCPLDRLLVETDTPFLAPVPHRGTVNEPARVALVGKAIADVKGLPTIELAERSTANALAAFGL